MTRGRRHSAGPWIRCWFLVCSCCLLPLNTTHSNPLPDAASGRDRPPAAEGSSSQCAPESISELIQRSPVILKALGARIFTESDALWLLDGGSFLTAPQGQPSTVTTKIEASRGTHFRSDDDDGGDQTAAYAPSEIFITLTPETIYKGASLLTMSPSAGTATRSRPATCQYEGQLNATLPPLSCFDVNVLKTLPTALIAFGKLVTVQRQQQRRLRTPEIQQQPQKEPPQTERPRGGDPQQQQRASDILRISINGLHRWSAQFEKRVWKHLGWDDWSDFTLCSVTCGKGVQQRFRRCRLDNPMMMNLNVNQNRNPKAAEDETESRMRADGDDDSDGNDDEDDDDDDDDGGDDVGTDGSTDNSMNDDIVLAEDLSRLAGPRDDSHARFRDRNANNNNNRNNYVPKRLAGDDEQSKLSMASSESEEETAKATQHESTTRKSGTTAVTTDTADGAIRQPRHLRKQWTRYSKDFRANEVDAIVHDSTVDDVDVDVDDVNDDGGDEEVMRIFEGSKLSGESLITTTTTTTTVKNMQATSSAADQSTRRGSAKSCNQEKRRRKKNQIKTKKKSAKSLSTLFCEGYNIEQRNCNTFECSDDISELLKFYKKAILPEDFSTTAISSSLQSLASDVQASSSSPLLSNSTEASAPATSAATSAATGGASAGLLPSPTPSNLGYVKSWPNSINFTIMISLRVKNDTKTTARIFSIRNSTHHLYLEPGREGLRLYLERDNATEMLAAKFNLYDYRWHQVAISIQNGDFISIFVDCSWTNSFVVSKHLFSLPVESDVEIGRGFNGELQQLLVLPGNQERHQCSSVRTSINEVKRYIIDTFIDDYSN